MNIDDDEYLNHYMKRVYLHDSDDGRWLRWMDAICFPDYEPFEFDETNWYILEYDGTYVGYCGWRKASDDVAELCRAGVLPQERGNGFQRYMIEYRERQAKRDGFTFCVSTTSPFNHVSMNNLIRAGYMTLDGSYCPNVLPDKNNGIVSSVFWKKKL